MSDPLPESEGLERWARQCSEWEDIRDEMIAAGREPTAFEVSLEQRKRALAEGRKLVRFSDDHFVECTPSEVLSEFGNASYEDESSPPWVPLGRDDT